MPEPLTILERLGRADQTFVKEHVETYGNLVWTLAEKQTDSPEEAKSVTCEIFVDIWQYAGRYDSTEFDEITFIFLIARTGIFLTGSVFVTDYRFRINY